MDLDFGLVRLGESSTQQLSITNRSNIVTDWSMGECNCQLDGGDEDLPCEFVFVPACGSLSPGQSTIVSVTFKPTVCRRVRTVFQCQVKNGKTRYV